MHKCFKCGAEFEGNFCPECGTQWQENKHCPNCGATLAGGAKFCNNCGYSFVESAEEKKPAKEKKPSKVGAFFKKVWLWIKRHAKVVFPTACALIVVIVVCSLIPTFILMGVNGTYYALLPNGELSEKSYITLSTGKWTDSDGNEGTYSRSGSSVTLKYHDQAAEDFGDMFGEEVPTEVELNATVEDSILTITDGERAEVYVIKSHKHEYGKWETVRAATCDEMGLDKRTCKCSATETRTRDGHKYNYKYQCTICGAEATPTDGLEIEIVTVDGSSYGVVKGFIKGSGEYSPDVIFPKEKDGVPITEIGNGAFKGCTALANVLIPDSVTAIGDSAFENCTSLDVVLSDGVTVIGDSAFENCTSIRINLSKSVKKIGANAFCDCKELSIEFRGSEKDWGLIEKGSDWCKGNNSFYFADADGGSGYGVNVASTSGCLGGLSHGSSYLIIGLGVVTVLSVAIAVPVVIAKKKKKNQNKK